MGTQILPMLIVVSALFLGIIISISFLVGILGRYAFRRKCPDKNSQNYIGAPQGAPRSLGLLFMRMNFARIIIALTTIYGILVAVILGNAEPALISVFATLGGASIGGLSYDQFDDNDKKNQNTKKDNDES